MSFNPAAPSLSFDNSYARLPERAFVRLAPQKPKAPRLVALNADLAQWLGLPDLDWQNVLSGQSLPEGAEPLSQAYAGHQFGNFVPQLGDGRAHLIGEILTPRGRFDLQLKGSGQTPFSRRGDGKAALGPMLREYIISEAMAGLGLPTTRSLAVVETGDSLWRDQPVKGAVLCRIAKSHVRVGTLQYFAARGDGIMVETLVRYTLNRHYPDESTAENPALALYHAVIDAQASLIAGWMAAGFIHGVMNTDNVALSGETIDYGPCAFLDDYQAQKVFSSIDSQGRYAYGNQGRIGQWNMARLAEALLPLFDDNEDKAVELAHAGLERYAARFEHEWLNKMGAKIGLPQTTRDDKPLIDDVLKLMERESADFTLTFRAFCDDPSSLSLAFAPWLAQWQQVLQAKGIAIEAAQRLMQQHNPVLIARNHRVAEALAAAEYNDFVPFHRLCQALKTPFVVSQDLQDLTRPPTPDQCVSQTFCGT